ncbi:MAG: tetratricopeptide repeat protein [Alphaproteobacteria bacterium]|nr:tetratricopeptide repeat protein [Alphaproteobacteria bacterium]
MDKRSDELLQEVNEQLQWERFENIVKEYGSYILAAVLAVIIGVAGYTYWNHSQEMKNQALSEKLTGSLSLVGKKQMPEALKGLQELSENTSTYGMLARFMEAAIQIDDPKTREAAAGVYKNMLDQQKVDRRYRSLAVLFYAMAELDSGDSKALASLLDESSRGTNMWPHTTAELSAYVAIKNGDVEKAKDILTQLIANKDLTQGTQVRARALLQTLEQK